MRNQQTKQPHSRRRGTVAIQHVLTLAVGAIVLINLQAIWKSQIRPSVEKLVATVLQQESSQEIAAGNAFTQSNEIDDAQTESFPGSMKFSRMSRSIDSDEGDDSDLPDSPDSDDPPEDEDQIPVEPEEPAPKGPDDDCEKDDDDEENEGSNEDEDEEEDQDDEDEPNGGSAGEESGDEQSTTDSGMAFPNSGLPAGGIGQPMMPGQGMMPGQPMMPGQGMMQGQGTGTFPNQWPNNRSQNANIPAEQRLSRDDQQSDQKGETLLDKFLPSDEGEESDSYEEDTVEIVEDKPHSKAKQEAERQQAERDGWTDSIHDGIRQSGDSGIGTAETPKDEHGDPTSESNLPDDFAVLSMGKTREGRPQLNLAFFGSFVELHLHHKDEWKYFRVPATAKNAVVPLDSAITGEELRIRAFRKTGDSVDLTYTIPNKKADALEKFVNATRKFGEQ